MKLRASVRSTKMGIASGHLEADGDLVKQSSKSSQKWLLSPMGLQVGLKV